MQMTIYDAATVGSRSNCVYPNPVTVTDADTMRQELPQRGQFPESGLSADGLR